MNSVTSHNKFSCPWWAHAAIALVLAVGFSGLIWQDHAFGAWGDDSPGYTYLAGRLLHHQPLIYQDPIVKAGLDFFDSERVARWLTPTHHEIISPSGWVGSIYPIGLSVIMWLAAIIWNSDLAIYAVVPVCAGMVVGLTYILSLMLAKTLRFRTLIALTTSLALGSAQLFYEHSIAQPMREIPSMVFLILGSIFALWAFDWRKKISWRTTVLWLCAGMAFGMATNIRETSVLVWPAIIPLMATGKGWLGLKAWAKNCWKPVIIFILGFLLVFSISIWNSVEITQHKVKFKKKDITSVAITSNIDHLRSLSLENIFDNQGKFKPGEGALPHYWDVMRHSTAVIFFFPLIPFGWWMLWKRDKARAWLVIAWPMGILFIFSLWINPYSRYLLPAFPALIFLSVLGVVWFTTEIVPRLVTKRWNIYVVNGLVMLGIITPLYQTIAQEVTALRTTDILMYKAISYNDVEQLKDVGSALPGDHSVILLFSGDWQYGISETFELHTQIKSIRFPLENKRFDIHPEKVAKFLRSLIDNGYDMYIWTDETSSIETQEFFSSHFTRVPVKTLSSSYAAQISIEQIK